MNIDNESNIIKNFRFFSDRAKPIVRWGRKATDLLKDSRVARRQPGCLILVARLFAF